MFENMYGGKNIKYKYFDFIYVYVIRYTLGHSTLQCIAYAMSYILIIKLKEKHINDLYFVNFDRKIYYFHLCHVMKWR